MAPLEELLWIVCGYFGLAALLMTYRLTRRPKGQVMALADLVAAFSVIIGAVYLVGAMITLHFG
ncbi:hypothetical protein GURKE_00150 [Brevundimonas phage vB_BpoS-Gurke]|uniref:Uncharacterized protein n=1 Tax=Brevundimonas phage vB_BpoS-Gurke TaxID=2948599 RepID=A0A9E7N3W0_9CAUD|nr:hypothetical protein GURKE_00150 [Brevundimonas phage vB_BpoS-Gurke]